MSSNECFHFTYLNRAYSIRRTGLNPRSEENSKVIKDSSAKVSFSDGRYAAAGLMANFYRTYTDIKTGKRDPSRTDPNLAQRIIKSKSFEDFLGDGMYFMFDGTDIENTGGNRGHINPFDAGTKETIEPSKLKVCTLRNQKTGELLYSKYDFAQYLMANLTQDDYSKMPSNIVDDIEFYKQAHSEEMSRFESSNYSVEFMTIDEFCQTFKKEIDKAIEQSQNQTHLSEEMLYGSGKYYENIEKVETLVSPRAKNSIQNLTRQALESEHAKSSDIAQLTRVENEANKTNEKEGVSIDE